MVPTDPRVVEHLARVQCLIGDDLEWVEVGYTEPAATAGSIDVGAV